MGLPDDVELPDDVDPEYIDQILEEMKKNEEFNKDPFYITMRGTKKI